MACADLTSKITKVHSKYLQFENVSDITVFIDCIKKAEQKPNALEHIDKFKTNELKKQLEFDLLKQYQLFVPCYEDGYYQSLGGLVKKHKPVQVLDPINIFLNDDWGLNSIKKPHYKLGHTAFTFYKRSDIVRSIRYLLEKNAINNNIFDEAELDLIIQSDWNETYINTVETLYKIYDKYLWEYQLGNIGFVHYSLYLPSDIESVRIMQMPADSEYKLIGISSEDKFDKDETGYIHGDYDGHIIYTEKNGTVPFLESSILLYISHEKWIEFMNLYSVNILHGANTLNVDGMKIQCGPKTKSSCVFSKIHNKCISGLSKTEADELIMLTFTSKLSITDEHGDFDKEKFYRDLIDEPTVATFEKHHVFVHKPTIAQIKSYIDNVRDRQGTADSASKCGCKYGWCTRIDREYTSNAWNIYDPEKSSVGLYLRVKAKEYDRPREELFGSTSSGSSLGPRTEKEYNTNINREAFADKMNSLKKRGVYSYHRRPIGQPTLNEESYVVITVKQLEKNKFFSDKTVGPLGGELPNIMTRAEIQEELDQMDNLALYEKIRKIIGGDDDVVAIKDNYSDIEATQVDENEFDEFDFDEFMTYKNALHFIDEKDIMPPNEGSHDNDGYINIRVLTCSDWCQFGITNLYSLKDAIINGVRKCPMCKQWYDIENSALPPYGSFSVSKSRGFYRMTFDIDAGEFKEDEKSVHYPKSSRTGYYPTEELMKENNHYLPQGRSTDVIHDYGLMSVWLAWQAFIKGGVLIEGRSQTVKLIKVQYPGADGMKESGYWMTHEVRTTDDQPADFYDVGKSYNGGTIVTSEYKPGANFATYHLKTTTRNEQYGFQESRDWWNSVLGYIDTLNIKTPAQQDNHMKLLYRAVFTQGFKSDDVFTGSFEELKGTYVLVYHSEWDDVKGKGIKIVSLCVGSGKWFVGFIENIVDDTITVNYPGFRRGPSDYTEEITVDTASNSDTEKDGNIRPVGEFIKKFIEYYRLSGEFLHSLPPPPPLTRQ